jgi:hypothetical protein
MDESIREFGMNLGRRLLARDWSGARSLLAPWLRAKLAEEDVRRFLEDEYRATLSANGTDGLHYPEHPEPGIDGNTHTSASDLREPISWEGNRVRDVAPEVTDANMCYWMSLQLQCSDAQMESLGFDYFAEVWLAVVRTDEGLRVGYWSQGAY